MHNFKKVLKTFLVLVVCVALLAALDLALYPCTFMRNDVHAVVTQQFDDIIVGTSHGKMDIDPEVMQEVTGRSGHNLCVGGEYGIDAYYLTKLIKEKQNPKRIIYEVDPGYFVSEKEEGNNYLLFYHEFPFSKAKVEYFWNSIAKCNFRTVLFPWYEYSLSYELPKVKSRSYASSSACSMASPALFSLPIYCSQSTSAITPQIAISGSIQVRTLFRKNCIPS